MPYLSKSICLGGVIVAGTLLTTGFLFVLKNFSSTGDVPLLDTPAWRGMKLKYGEQLMLRRASENGGPLLLKYSNQPVVYKYDPLRQDLTAVTDDEWEHAHGRIAECSKQFSPSPLILKIDAQKNRLIAKERVVPTAGRTPLGLTESPGGKWVAVLSAEGFKWPSLLPFEGSNGASGQYYHQLMSLPDAAATGKPIRIPTRRNYDTLIACWSADEQYVIYHHVTFNYLSVVKVTLPSTPTM
jgi:hypothetical protein